jgi:hypothetical protein
MKPMIMRIKLSCPNCIEKVFAAVGKFVGNDSGPSTILRVDAFHAAPEMAGVVTTWDIHPTRDQIAEFRQVWDETTGMLDVVILHDAPSTIVDRPNVAAWN